MLKKQSINARSFGTMNEIPLRSQHAYCTSQCNSDLCHCGQIYTYCTDWGTKQEMDEATESCASPSNFLQ